MASSVHQEPEGCCSGLEPHTRLPSGTRPVQPHRRGRAEARQRPALGVPACVEHSNLRRRPLRVACQYCPCTRPALSEHKHGRNEQTGCMPPAVTVHGGSSPPHSLLPLQILACMHENAGVAGLILCICGCVIITCKAWLLALRVVVITREHMRRHQGRATRQAARAQGRDSSGRDVTWYAAAAQHNEHLSTVTAESADPMPALCTRHAPLPRPGRDRGGSVASLLSSKPTGSASPGPVSPPSATLSKLNSATRDLKVKAGLVLACPLEPNGAAGGWSRHRPTCGVVPSLSSGRKGAGCSQTRRLCGGRAHKGFSERPGPGPRAPADCCQSHHRRQALRVSGEVFRGCSGARHRPRHCSRCRWHAALACALEAVSAWHQDCSRIRNDAIARHRYTPAILPEFVDIETFTSSKPLTSCNDARLSAKQAAACLTCASIRNRRKCLAQVRLPACLYACMHSAHAAPPPPPRCFVPGSEAVQAMPQHPPLLSLLPRLLPRTTALTRSRAPGRAVLC